ncbi:MAG: GAF domain-containing SpoIIE family protein phosphatase [Candidatus Promineifilaceae bacterium]
MLELILPAQTEQLTRLGQIWQAQGATGLCLWQENQVVWQWPDQTTPLNPEIWVEIGDGVALGVAGCRGPVAETQLRADAHIIGYAAALERDLEMMTGELIDSQDQLLALYDLTRSTRSYLDIADTLNTVVTEVARLVKVESAFAILQAPPECPHLVACYPHCRLSESEMLGLFRQVQMSGVPFLRQGPDAAATLPDSVYNLLFVPVQVQGQMLVGLGFINRLLGDFRSPDLKLIQAIAEQAGVQIENALLLQETVHQARLQTEMKLARDVQLQLLPQHPPQVAGLTLYARSLPAMQVGGDFYDFIQEPGRPLIFTVGDVSGKGVSSALVMTMIRTVIRSAGRFDPQATPQSLLDRANRDLYDDFTDLAMFATVFVGQYDAKNRCLTYANAGHSPVIYCPAGGAARLLEADGTAVGILPDNLATNQKLPFGNGDVLIAATDGFSEAQDTHGQFFGYDRLLELVKTHCHKTAREIAEILFAAVMQFASGHLQDDDQTLIVVKGGEGL